MDRNNGDQIMLKLTKHWTPKKSIFLLTTFGYSTFNAALAKLIESGQVESKMDGIRLLIRKNPTQLSVRKRRTRHGDFELRTIEPRDSQLMPASLQ